MAKEIVTGSREKGYILYNDDTFLLCDVRGAWPHLGRAYQGKPDPKTGKSSDPKYSIKAMLNKTQHAKHIQLLEREIGKVLKAQNKGQELEEANVCLRDGDRRGSKDFEKGHMILSMSEREERAPALRGMQNERLERDTVGAARIDNMMMGGYRYDILGKLWWQDNSWGKKVNCNLLAVKLRAKDEVIAGEGAISDEDVDDAFGIADGDAGFDAGSDDEL